MYTQEQLINTFNSVCQFFKWNEELIKVDNSLENRAVFYIANTAKESETEAIAKAVSSELHINVEVKHLSGREKAQTIGGCGPCGKPLCCSTWLKCPPNISESALKGEKFTDKSEYLGICGEIRCCLVYLDENFKLPCQQSKPKETAFEENTKEKENAKIIEPGVKKAKVKVVRRLTFKNKH